MGLGRRWRRVGNCLAILRFSESALYFIERWIHLGRQRGIAAHRLLQIGLGPIPPLELSVNSVPGHTEPVELP